MNYYKENTEDFIKNTINVDMTELYDIFAGQLSVGASILDIGCGSGRDLKHFKISGFNALGLEPCHELALFANNHSGCKVECSTIESFDSAVKFDGIWACASLLHLDTKSLRESFLKISSLMNKDSIFYCSFKHGEYEGERNGRFFNDQTLDSIKEILPTDLSITKSWITEDLRGNRDKRWLNLTLKLF